MPHFDTNLVFLYSENARFKVREIASILKKSPQRVKYNLKVLDEKHILYGSHCVFDYSYFGLILFRVYFKGGYVSEKDRTQIIEKLMENPYVVSIQELNGEFDLVVELLSPNPSRFNKELKRIASELPTLNNYKIVLNVVSHLYPRIYMISDLTMGRTLHHEIIVGGDRDFQQFEEKELNILRVLLRHPLVRLTDLARESGMNVKTSTHIFRYLQRNRVVKGFKRIVDTSELGIFRFRLFLRLHNISQDKEKSLLDHLSATKEAIQVHKTVGDWEMEIDIESADKARIRFITVQMREDFRDLIETFNIMEMGRTHKKTYLPEYLFESENATTFL